MTSRTLALAGRPSATPRTAMSRSVTMPIRRSFSPTGKAPQLSSRMRKAASLRRVFGPTRSTSRVITAFTCIAYLRVLRVRILRRPAIAGHHLTMGHIEIGFRAVKLGHSLFTAAFTAVDGDAVSSARSAAAAVEGHDLEGRGRDAFEAADIDGGHGLARRVSAESEGRAAAGRAEMMLDDVLVEQVGGERAFRHGEPQALARDEPQQVALAAAMGAVALDDLGEIALHLERDAAAMAAAFVGHGILPFRQCNDGVCRPPPRRRRTQLNRKCRHLIQPDGCSGRAEAERRAAAGRAEVVLDDMSR